MQATWSALHGQSAAQPGVELRGAAADGPWKGKLLYISAARRSFGVPAPRLTRYLMTVEIMTVDMPTGPFIRPTVRARGKVFWARFLRAVGVLRVSRKWVQRQGAVVLAFHRILTDEELELTASLPGMIVRRETFDGFLKYAVETCQFVQLPVAPEWKQNQRLKVAITFDDGWLDNASSACPIAQKHQAPMAIFVVPERTGTVLPFWPERAASALDRQMSAADRAQNGNYVEQTIERLKGLSAQERKRRIDEMTSS